MPQTETGGWLLDGGPVPASPVCNACVHLDWESFSKGDRRCAAFPKEIPLEIWNGDNLHTEPYPGDNGIQFKAKE